MIKIDKFTSSTGLTRLEKILDQRRNSQSKNIPIVSKIIKKRSNSIAIPG